MIVRDIDTKKKYFLYELTIDQKRMFFDKVEVKGSNNLSLTDRRFIYYYKEYDAWVCSKFAENEELRQIGVKIERNALELFYTLENIQVNCKELNRKEIEYIKLIYESYGYNIIKSNTLLDVEENYCYFGYINNLKSIGIWSNDINKYKIEFKIFIELFKVKE